MKYERLECGIERFVLGEDRFGKKKCRLVLFGIYFAKEIAALDSGRSNKCLNKLADKVREKRAKKGMRTELSLAVNRLSNHVTLKSCVIEAIEAAMID